jgi:hypothetical protein
LRCGASFSSERDWRLTMARSAYALMWRIRNSRSEPCQSRRSTVTTFPIMVASSPGIGVPAGLCGISRNGVPSPASCLGQHKGVLNNLTGRAANACRDRDRTCGAPRESVMTCGFLCRCQDRSGSVSRGRLQISVTRPMSFSATCRSICSATTGKIQHQQFGRISPDWLRRVTCALPDRLTSARQGN